MRAGHCHSRQDTRHVVVVVTCDTTLCNHRRTAFDVMESRIVLDTQRDDSHIKAEQQTHNDAKLRAVYDVHTPTCATDVLLSHNTTGGSCNRSVVKSLLCVLFSVSFGCAGWLCWLPGTRFWCTSKLRTHSHIVHTKYCAHFPHSQERKNCQNPATRSAPASPAQVVV